MEASRWTPQANNFAGWYGLITFSKKWLENFISKDDPINFQREEVAHNIVYEAFARLPYDFEIDRRIITLKNGYTKTTLGFRPQSK